MNQTYCCDKQIALFNEVYIMNVKLSVIVPVYNSEKYLERCIDSIINQTFEDIEILLVNDGSTDSSFEICRKYEINDSRIKVLNKPNSGVSDTRNVGIENSTGEFITFVDSDDELDQSMYEKMLGNAKENEADIVFCGFKKFTDEGIYCENLKNLREVAKGAIEPFFYSKDAVMGSVWRAIFRKEIVGDLRFDKNIVYEEDKIFVLNCIGKSKRISVVEECLYHYYTSGNIKRRYYDNLFDNRKNVYFQEEKYLKRESEELALFEKCKIYLNCVMITLISENDYKEKLRKLHSDNFYKEARSIKCIIAYMKEVSFKGKLMALIVKLKWFALFKAILKRLKNDGHN